MRLEFTEDDLKIELCPECKGAKLVFRTIEAANVTVTEQLPCPACDGRGLKLTRTGALLFDFVREAGRYH